MVSDTLECLLFRCEKNCKRCVKRSVKLLCACVEYGYNSTPSTRDALCSQGFVIFQSLTNVVKIIYRAFHSNRLDRKKWKCIGSEFGSCSLKRKKWQPERSLEAIMSAADSAIDQAKALGMAQQEMEYRVDLFNRYREP